MKLIRVIAHDFLYKNKNDGNLAQKQSIKAQTPRFLLKCCLF